MSVKVNIVMQKCKEVTEDGKCFPFKYSRCNQCKKLNMILFKQIVDSIDWDKCMKGDK